MPAESEIVVQVCPPESRIAALELLLADIPVPQRAEQARLLEKSASGGESSFDGLFLATLGEIPTAACWAQLQPGRTGVLWPPLLRDETPETAASELLAAANRYFTMQQVALSQALLADSQAQTSVRLLEAGYTHLTDLEYLVCLLRPKSPPQISNSIEYEVYSERNHERFSQIVERTYRASLDCPELDGLREIEDILDGYRATGEFHPSRWLILRHAGKDAGCLLLTDHPEQHQWELVYLGLLPETRGKGLGVEATQFATQLAFGAGRKQMVLAVDSRNVPAKAVYERAGFIEWDRRSVYLRHYGEDAVDVG